MKKSELIQELIKIEQEIGENATITMSYTHYLEKIKRIVEMGDVEI